MGVGYRYDADRCGVCFTGGPAQRYARQGRPIGRAAASGAVTNRDTKREAPGREALYIQSVGGTNRPTGGTQ